MPCANIVHLRHDTDVVIGAHKRPEHTRLKELANQGSVELYWSPTGQLEQAARSIEASRAPLPNDPESASAALLQRRSLDRSETAERDWWRPAQLHYPRCTFEGLIATAIAPLIGDALGDPTGKLRLFDDLLRKRGVGDKDAIHLMIAHSAGVDRLLTWDVVLIKKAARVSWLGPEVQTPADFLASGACGDAS